MKAPKKPRDIVIIAMAAALICISSYISVPLGSVPVTLQSFAVLLVLQLLGGRRGLVCVLLYLCVGAVGLPVFSGFTGGVGRFFDATGGFLLGFLLMALVYLLLEGVFGCGGRRVIIYGCIAIVCQHALGVLFYSFVYLSGEGSFGGAFLTVSLPYLPLDALKLLLSYFLSSALHKRKIII